MKDTLAMMRAFFSDLWRYRREVTAQDRWIRRYAVQHGYSVNPRWMIFTNLKLWLIDSQQLFGKRYCPCFEPSGEAELDRRLTCPCTFLAEEVAAHGTLFGRAGYTKADYKTAESRLMQEYRGVPLRLEGHTLDTRGMPRDLLRGLQVPDALHQVKRGWSVTREDRGDHVVVRLA
jgi:ferredoxin-thioredoxin reductase catalytic subunit